ncbi:MAG: TldD/PmbA family protein, partial [Clostridia bacterium]|nr:TldD/PmbA family protein [Clostridia bacterium]
MTKKEKYKLARWAMEFALNNGAQDARVYISNNNSSQIEVRESKIDKLQEANQSSMNIDLYVDNKYSTISTNRINNQEELKSFIKQAIDGTKYLAEDEFRTLPDPELYYKGGGEDLKTVDTGFWDLDPQKKVQNAFKVEEEVLGKDERIISVDSSYRDSYSGRVMVASNGFEGDSENSSYSLSASVSVKDEEARPRSYWYESSIFYDELIKEGIGEKALKRTLERLGQEKIKSATMPMILENRVASQVVSPVISALNGASIHQRNSFLIDMKGEKIGSDLMDITDDPFIISGRGSRHFDGEGIATRKRKIIENGVLMEYYIDTYYGKKLEMETTSGGTTNLVFKPGDKDLEGLLADIDRGIYVNRFNGGNHNGSTGDFSYGIEGFLIENGKIVKAVNEMNITGNYKQIWK